MTYVRSDETEADAVERVLDRVAVFPFEIDLFWPHAKINATEICLLN